MHTGRQDPVAGLGRAGFNLRLYKGSVKALFSRPSIFEKKVGRLKIVISPGKSTADVLTLQVVVQGYTRNTTVFIVFQQQLCQQNVFVLHLTENWPATLLAISSSFLHSSPYCIEMF